MKRTLFTIVTAGMVSVAALGGAALASDHKDAAEIALFQKATHDVGAAIKAAETASGGKAVSAEFDDKDGSGIWEVKTINGTKRAEIKIDAATGQVVKTSAKGDAAKDDHAVTPEMLGGTLADLVAKAEAQGGGKVMAIDPDHENGQFRGMEVEIVKADGSVHDFILHPTDGKLTPVIKGQDGNSDNDESGETNG